MYLKKYFVSTATTVLILTSCGGGGGTTPIDNNETQNLNPVEEASYNFDGTWRGNVYQESGLVKRYPAVMYIDRKKEKYTIDYPTLACGETLTLIKSEDEKLYFSAELLYGFSNCIDNGKVTISKKSEKKITWVWTGKYGPAYSVLKKDTLSRKDISGTWKGAYTCTQGLTGITLTIKEKDVDELSKTTVLEANFSFYEVSENSGVPSGEYLQKEKLFDGESLIWKSLSWIDNPGGYTMVDFSGKFSENGTKYNGTVIGNGSSCTTFALTKER